ncbi:MAG: hypothetical protein JWQ35_1383, partial [Bacteriovoracaceae bacterium]|nr:hypothetical protein [Bacteriovoracaceae bacterium]
MTKTLSAMLGLCLSVQVLANSEHIHQSIHDGRTPYLVVRPDNVGGSQREPGIYFGDQDGNWKLAIKGNVLAGETSQGILGEFSLSKTSGRYESIAVVDGKIILFHQRTRFENPESYIELSPKHILPVDVFARHPFELEPIQKFQDVQASLMEEASEGQGILFSIRQKSPFGSGVTFAAFLKKKGTDEQSSSLTLASEPRILDFNFHNYSELQRLVHLEHTKYGVISENVLNHYMKEQENDPPALEAWRKSLQYYFNVIKTGETGRRDTFMPWLDLLDQKVKLAHPPSKDFLIGTLRLLQV